MLDEPAVLLVKGRKYAYFIYCYIILYKNVNASVPTET
jgi:hypothetical protein